MSEGPSLGAPIVIAFVVQSSATCFWIVPNLEAAALTRAPARIFFDFSRFFLVFVASAGSETARVASKAESAASSSLHLPPSSSSKHSSKRTSCSLSSESVGQPSSELMTDSTHAPARSDWILPNLLAAFFTAAAATLMSAFPSSTGVVHRGLT